MKADFVHKDTLTGDFVENYIREHTSTKHFRICNDNCKLKQENKSLKKQLEEANKMCELFVKSVYNAELYELKNQQKEFVKYLEDEKDRLARETSNIYEDSLGKTRLVNEDIFNEVNKVLSKYKEIIGEENE